MDTMHEWIFVAPRGHMATLVAFLDSALQTLPGVPASKVGAAAISLPPASLPQVHGRSALVEPLARELARAQFAMEAATAPASSPPAS